MYGILMPGVGELVAAAPEVAEMNSLSGSSRILGGRQIYQSVGRPNWAAKTVRSFSFTPYEGRLGAALERIGVQRPYMDEVVITQRNWQTASTCDMPHEMSHVRFGRNYPQLSVLQNRTWLPGSGYSAWVDEALAYGPESGSRFAFYRALDSLSVSEKANILATSAGLVGAGAGIYLAWSNYLRK
jgi:hypothetical protein